mgnify:CR=1 FL=1
MGLIYYFSAQSKPAVPSFLLWNDKITHFLEYALLGLLLIRALKKEYFKGGGKHKILSSATGDGSEGVPAPLPRGDSERSERQRGGSPYGQENSDIKVIPNKMRNFLEFNLTGLKLIALLIATAYGASDEFHQGFIIGRKADFFDWLVDFYGSAFGSFCISIKEWSWGRKKSSNP